jgi:hypothetical protein
MKGYVTKNNLILFIFMESILDIMGHWMYDVYVKYAFHFALKGVKE